MDNRQQLIDRILNPDIPVQVFRAVVKSVEGLRCTVQLLPDFLEIDNVSLVAEEDADGWFCVTPEVESIVLVACIENELSNLCLIQAGQVASIDLMVDKTRITADKKAVSITQDQTSIKASGSQVKIEAGGLVVEFAGNKAKIANDSTSLKGLFDDLSSLIQNLKVMTAQGPSTALTPDTIAALTQFKTKYPTLLA